MFELFTLKTEIINKYGLFIVTFFSIFRLDELQKKLQEDIRQGRGIKSPLRTGDQDSTDDGDGLLEEHR